MSDVILRLVEMRRFPLIVAAISALPRRWFLLDGEAMATEGCR